MVFGGDQIKDSSGHWAIFDEVGSVPTSMAVCRALLCGHALNQSTTELLQSDCQRAYIQAKLTGPPTFIELPREWWPAKWQGMRRPVCCLDKALYGHPKAGDLWADRLSTVLGEDGFEKVENWQSLFHKSTPKGPIIIDVYVDDLVMF